MVNYQKNNGNNPYIVQLSILADELSLNGYGQVISNSLTEFCRQYDFSLCENHSKSWFPSFIGNMFLSDDICEKNDQVRATNIMLLALYEAINLNRNFITTLTHTQTDSSSPPSPSR